MASASSPLLGSEAPLAQFERISILVADDSQMGCQLLSAGLRRSRLGFEVVASALNRSEIIHGLSQRHVDIVLVSETLADGPFTGIQALSDIRACHIAARAVLLISSASPELVLKAFCRGASGVFSRNESFETLCKCIRAVRKGQIWANNDQVHAIIEAVAASPYKVNSHGRSLLSKREDEVASLVAEGLTSREVAQKLNLTENTVKNHLFRIYGKLGISTRVELVLHVLGQRARNGS